MTDAEFDQAVWERIQALMPICKCGERTKPGAAGPTVLLFVCPSCSSVTAANADAVEAITEQAVADVERMEANA